MKNLIKKFGALLGVGAVVMTMAFPSSVLAGSATKPREAKGNQSSFENPSMIGCNVCSVDASTTGKQCATGSGLLYWLSASGDNVSGKGVRAFDCANGTHLSGLTASGAIGPKVYACAGSSSFPQGNLSPWDPGRSAPARFENGLAIKTDDSGIYAQACWRYDSGVNP